MPELLKEEQCIIKCLSQYGPLTYRQLLLLTGKPKDTAKKILRNLKNWAYIFNLGQGYWTIDPTAHPEPKTVKAVWVLLQFRERIEPMNHHPAQYPAQLFFLKGDSGYEVVVLNRGEEHLLRLLAVEENTKYIIVLEDMAMLEKLKLPKAPCLFATTRETGSESPEVLFYGGMPNAG